MYNRGVRPIIKSYIFNRRFSLDYLILAELLLKGKATYCDQSGRVLPVINGEYSIFETKVSGYVGLHYRNELRSYTKTCLAHRAIHTAFRFDPCELVIDHLNRNKSDNRLVNLEAVTLCENSMRIQVKTRL